ncbi:Pimeloyl-ACP methyl ester carboxylesterase [Pseudomonas taetrolens]|uniref:Alpha/beta hydrolase n=2 Tax=Pseudomonas taetrolens TaxID=47884 RepID=A0A0J6GUL6_PSETA|nr:alpha/beta hydrolase [Pseudomonas taetrolens]SEC32930.1 Pimeloyl-ACP methyl ester carboxylesterase [Pseudomonas taetrolens]SQF86363.1 Alpha/beta hydrolase fold [Pseudomonas taetrolens]VEH49440.1 Alpha/beta hydrolase fold [Pseudomonas taetrolens]
MAFSRCLRSCMALACTLPLLAVAAPSAPGPVYGEELQGFEYPYPLHRFEFNSQGQPVQMGYMDISPSGKANGRTAVLMHGKNFCAATWGDSIKALSAAGYRVVAADQIGFCTSSKPEYYQYSFQQLADNTHALLTSLGIDKASVVGHSTGGMLATRYALMYAPETEKLVLVNPIGLEDWKALGVPWRTIDQWYERELKLSAEGIRKYEQSTYYGGRWKPEYDRWVDMLAGLNKGPGHKRVAWNSALIYDMIFTQPVFYELPALKVPTVLLIGDADTTAIGSDIASPEVKARIGDYTVLGKQAAKLIPGATLVEFPGMGHAPQMEDPPGFNKVLIEQLNGG